MDNSGHDKMTAEPALFRGSNQSGLRDYNERLVLSMIQRLGPMPGVEIARRAGLSSQTVSVILRGLQADGLVSKGDPVRGRVGKPSIPMGIAADGVFSIGLKIGRRTADLVLIDLHGQVREQMQMTYRYPMPDAILDFIARGLDTFRSILTQDQFKRISGIGVAKPFEIWNWHDTIGAPKEDIAAWRDLDFEGEIARFSNLPVFVENDATAACRAENVYGRGREFRDFAYFYIGSFVGGGVVLNHSVFEGVKGNSGAFGSLPVNGTAKGEGQLIDAASLYLLESELAKSGIDPTRIWNMPQDWSAFAPAVDAWIETSALHLAKAALTVCAVIDFEAVLIDGAFPIDVKDRLIARAGELINTFDTRGIFTPRIEAGIVGRNARALGAASAPIFSQYLLNTHGGLSAV